MSDGLELAARRMKRWRESPILFVKDNFGLTPDPWQLEMLDAARTYKRIVASACKGPGKTGCLAWLGWWFLACHPHAKVPCTSITGPNLKDGLWSEFAKWQARSAFLRQAFAWSNTRISCRSSPETWFASARQWKQDADPQQQANTLAGIHADYLLFLLDEVSDIPDGVVQAAEGALTSGIRTMLAMAGNPTRTAGPLYRAVVQDAALWKVVRISGDPEDPNRSPRIDLEEAKAQIQKYGRDSYVVRVNILGLFPERQADKLIDVKDCEIAMARGVSEAGFRADAKVLSLDVARFGDDASILTPRQGPVVFPQTEYRGLDTQELADRAVAAIDKWDADALFIDVGGVGAGTYDALKHRGFGDVCIPVDFGMRAADSERFMNKRAEMYWTAAEAVRGSLALPRDPMLAEELAAHIYYYDKRGRIGLQSKDEVKAVLGRSPDRADSVIMTFASPVRSRRREERSPYEDRRRGNKALRAENPLTQRSREGAE